LLKEAHRQHVLPAIFRIHDDLLEDGVGDIRMGFGSDNGLVDILARKFGK
jgi:hypothetical protein